jgi:hypothetical protein
MRSSLRRPAQTTDMDAEVRVRERRAGRNAIAQDPVGADRRRPTSPGREARSQRMIRKAPAPGALVTARRAWQMSHYLLRRPITTARTLPRSPASRRGRGSSSTSEPAPGPPRCRSGTLGPRPLPGRWGRPRTTKAPTCGAFAYMRRRGLEPPPGYPGPGPQPGNPAVISVRAALDRTNRPDPRTIRTHRTIWMLPRMWPPARGVDGSR